jgi:uncharacterized SAM-binding protein YcdF (DUF218 family)
MQTMSTTTGRFSWSRAVGLGVVALVVLGVILSYVWFVAPSTATVENADSADAVVVFAGGGDRLETAVELMERGLAPNLVIPNGESSDVEDEDLCDDAPFEVFCPETDTIDTRGEAQTIGRLAAELGWERLIAVTSTYHIHRATYQLKLCHDGPVQAVSAGHGIDSDALATQVVHEWAGTLAAMTFQRAC